MSIVVDRGVLLAAADTDEPTTTPAHNYSATTEAAFLRLVVSGDLAVVDGAVWLSGGVSVACLLPQRRPRTAAGRLSPTPFPEPSQFLRQTGATRVSRGQKQRPL